MPAPKHYDIRSIPDLVAAAKEGDLDTLMADLRTWLELHKSMPPEVAALFKLSDSEFGWNDDGRGGEVSSVTIRGVSPDA